MKCNDTTVTILCTQALPGILNTSCSVRKRTHTYDLFTQLSLASHQGLS